MLLQFLLDCIFPKHCLGCRQWDNWLCPTCRQTCFTPDRRGKRTLPHASIGRLYYLGHYQSTLLKQAISAMKYDGVKELATLFGEKLRSLVPVHDYNYVIPVPLHRRRLCERGFNQSTLLSVALDIPLVPILQRTVYTPAQAKLERIKRLANLTGVFNYDPTVDIELSNSSVLLVDDVYTTGTTMNSCAQLLLAAGCRKVDGAVIAFNDDQSEQPIE